MKIFLGIYEICGHYKYLKKGFENLGLNADLIVIEKNQFYDLPYSKISTFVHIWQKISNKRFITPKENLIKKVFYVIFHNILNILMITYVSIKYDVLIFSFGKTFTNSRIELIIYSLLRKKTIFIFHGSDSRPPYIGSFVARREEEPDYKLLKKETTRIKKKIKIIEKYASYVVNYITIAHFLENKFVDFLMLGLPVDLNEAYNDIKKRPDEPIKIIHAPSNSNLKGTKEIIEIIDKLKQKGLPIFLKHIQNMSNKKLLEELQNCDFVVDDLYSDSPMATLATEAAHLGKPTVVGGLFANYIHEFYDETDIPPSVYVDPSRIEEAIERLVVDEKYRNLMGWRAYRFVTEKWNISQIAKNYLKVINGDIPEKWYKDPKDVNFLTGYLSESRAKKVIKKMINEFGVDSLQVSDKPELVQKFIKFSQEDSSQGS